MKELEPLLPLLLGGFLEGFEMLQLSRLFRELLAVGVPGEDILHVSSTKYLKVVIQLLRVQHLMSFYLIRAVSAVGKTSTFNKHNMVVTQPILLAIVAKSREFSRIYLNLLE